MQVRMQLMVVGLATLVWMGAALFTWFDAKQELDELLDGHLAQAAAILVVQQTDADGDEDDMTDEPILLRYAPQVAFQVFHEGKLASHSTNAGQSPMASLGEGYSTVQLHDGEQWRVFATRGAERDVQVFVGEKVESRRAILWALLRSMMWPLGIALPLFGLAGWWSVRKGLTPLRRLSRTLVRRTPQALEPVVLADAPPELLPLIASLNALLQRISSMVVSERRFTADAAHELRTPIAAIRAQAQVAIGAGDDEAERAHALQLTLTGCDRATRLVEQLLTLARLESQAPATVAQTDLGNVARRVIADLVPGALSRAQTLELDAATGCLVAADELLLGVLVRNLVDNALRYSPDGARVVVRVQREGGAISLCVEDSGPGLEPQALERLGERFYRVLGSGQPGSGLGWSIVKRLVEVFSASVQMERSAALGGLCVTVRWSDAGSKPGA